MRPRDIAVLIVETTMRGTLLLSKLLVSVLVFAHWNRFWVRVVLNPHKPLPMLPDFSMFTLLISFTVPLRPKPPTGRANLYPHLRGAGGELTLAASKAQ